MRRTHDDWFDTAPTWSPDGRFIVFSSYRKGTQVQLADDIQKDGLKIGDGWVLVRLDVATGTETVLTKDLRAPAFDPSDDVGWNDHLIGAETSPGGAALAREGDELDAFDRAFAERHDGHRARRRGTAFGR